MEKGVFGSMIAVLAMASLLMAGCGSGGDDTSSLSRAKFLKLGNTICKKSEEEKGKALTALASKFDPSKPISMKRKEQLVLTIILPPYEKTTEDLEDLGAPEGDEEKLETIIEARKEAARKTKADPGVAVVSVREFEKANKLATKYGLSSCVV